MSRLIDAEIAYDKIAEQETSYYMDMEGVQSGLDETPTVDAVEVVRCKDCRHASPWFDGDAKKVLLQSGDVFCGLHSYLRHECHKPDWFCADGERRNDE